MWIVTDIGFFSMVQKPGEPHLTVRARVASDLDALRERVPELGPTIEAAGTDYPYRAHVPHAALAAGMAAMIEGITYSNFKSRVAATQGRSRESVYHRVWDALTLLERPSARR